MAVYQKVGSFQLHTATGTQTIGGLGFQPKAILFFHTPDTVDIATQTANYNMSYGVADGTNQYAICEFSPNGNNGNQTNWIAQTSNHCIVGSVDNSFIWRASLTSLDADGFTINVIVAPSLGYRVGYLAIGGAGITGVKAGAFQMTTGSHSETGFGFQPTGLIAFSAGLASLPSTPSFGTTTSASIAYGFSDGTSNRTNGTYHYGYNFTTVKRRLRSARNDNFLAAPNGTTSYAYAINLSTFDASGFTVSNAINGGGNYAFYLAFGGAQTKVSNFLSPTVSGSFSITGLGFTPNAVLMGSTWQTAFNSIEGEAIANGPGALMSVGVATDLLEQLTFGATSQGFTVTSVEGHHSDSLKLMRRFSHNPFTTLQMDFSLSSFTPGQIDLLCSTANATTSVISYMAIEGDGLIPPPPVDPTGGSGSPESPDSIFLLKYMGI